jgi:pheromone shutdown protein TraB
MTVGSLTLTVMLVVGAAGYTGVQGLLSSTTTTAKTAPLERFNREANADGVVTPAAIALALIAVFLMAVTAGAASPRRYPIDTP